MSREAFADAPPAKETTAAAGDRTLDGNTFLFPSTFPSAFVTSTAGVRAFARTMNVPNVPGANRSHSLELLGAGNVFDFGLKLDERWGIFLEAGGTGLVGSNIPALIYEPGTFLLGGTVGGILRLGRWESTQLALRASGGYAYGKIIGFGPFFGPTGIATASIDTVLDAFAGEVLRTPVKVITFDLGLSVAQALGRHFSLQGNVAFHPSWAKVEPFNFTTGQKDSVTSNVWGPSLGIAFAADGAHEFPFAAMLEYALTRRTAAETLLDVDETSTVHALTLDLFFTGAYRLQLGLFGTLELNLPSVVTRQGTSDSGNAELLGLALRYIVDPLP